MRHSSDGKAASGSATPVANDSPSAAAAAAAGRSRPSLDGDAGQRTGATPTRNKQKAPAPTGNGRGNTPKKGRTGRNKNLGKGGKRTNAPSRDEMNLVNGWEILDDITSVSKLQWYCMRLLPTKEGTREILKPCRVLSRGEVGTCGITIWESNANGTVIQYLTFPNIEKGLYKCVDDNSLIPFGYEAKDGSSATFNDDYLQRYLHQQAKFSRSKDLEAERLFLMRVFDHARDKDTKSRARCGESMGKATKSATVSAAVVSHGKGEENGTPKSPMAGRDGTRSTAGHPEEFQINEKLFLWDRGNLYEARVVKRNDLEEGAKYLVHCLGHKKSHGRWLHGDDMIKDTPPIRQLYEECRTRPSQDFQKVSPAPDISSDPGKEFGKADILSSCDRRQSTGPVGASVSGRTGSGEEGTRPPACGRGEQQKSGKNDGLYHGEVYVLCGELSDKWSNHFEIRGAWSLKNAPHISTRNSSQEFKLICDAPLNEMVTESPQDGKYSGVFDVSHGSSTQGSIHLNFQPSEAKKKFSVSGTGRSHLGGFEISGMATKTSKSRRTPVLFSVSLEKRYLDPPNTPQNIKSSSNIDGRTRDGADGNEVASGSAPAAEARDPPPAAAAAVKGAKSSRNGKEAKKSPGPSKKDSEKSATKTDGAEESVEKGETELSPEDAACPLLLGTLSSVGRHNVRRHIIRGFYADNPFQEFELIRNIPPEENLRELPKDGEFYGSFLNHMRNLKWKINGVMLRFTPKGKDGEFSTTFSVRGKGATKFREFELFGTAEKNKSDGDEGPTYTVSVRKRDVPKQPAADLKGSEKDKKRKHADSKGAIPHRAVHRQDMKKSQRRKEAEKRQREKDKQAELQRQRDSALECINIEVEADSPALSSCFDGVCTDKVNDPKHEQIVKNAVNSVRHNLDKMRRHAGNKGAISNRASNQRGDAPLKEGTQEKAQSNPTGKAAQNFRQPKRQRDSPPECISIEVEEDSLAPSSCFDGVCTDKVNDPKHEQIMKNAVDSVRHNLGKMRRHAGNKGAIPNRASNQRGDAPLEEGTQEKAQSNPTGKAAQNFRQPKRQRDSPLECISIEVEEDSLAPSSCFDGVCTDKVNDPKHEQIMKNAVDSVRHNLDKMRRHAGNKGAIPNRASNQRGDAPLEEGTQEKAQSNPTGKAAQNSQQLKREKKRPPPEGTSGGKRRREGGTGSGNNAALAKMQEGGDAAGTHAGGGNHKACAEGDGAGPPAKEVAMPSQGLNKGHGAPSEEDENSTSVPIKDSDSEDDIEKWCHFRLVISGKASKHMIKVPHRHDISFGRLRDEIEEGVTLPVASFRFTLFPGAPTLVDPKQEKDWKKWSIWEYLTKQGDGSVENPHHVFIEETG